MRNVLVTTFAAVFALGIGALQAAEGITLPKQEWSFSNPFTGKFDRAAIQRGLQVYREVCAGCHGVRLVAFRNLAEIGYSEEQIKAIAAEYSVVDGPDDDGEMFERDGKPSDRFPEPFPNDKAAAAANGGAAPPDLSLMIKARKGGADYSHALLMGYVDPPADFELLEGLSYNAYFPGHQIAMPPPLFDDAVEYADGTAATVDQMARDVVNFMAWTAEPELEKRHSMGIKVMIFLVVFCFVLYAAKRKVWADVH